MPTQLPISCARSGRKAVDDGSAYNILFVTGNDMIMILIGCQLPTTQAAVGAAPPGPTRI